MSEGFTEVSKRFRGEQSSGCETEFAQRREGGQRHVIYNIRTGKTMYKDRVLYTMSDRKLKLGQERRNEAGTESGVQGWHNKER